MAAFTPRVWPVVARRALVFGALVPLTLLIACTLGARAVPCWVVPVAATVGVRAYHLHYVGVEVGGCGTFLLANRSPSWAGWRSDVLGGGLVDRTSGEIRLTSLGAEGAAIGADAETSLIPVPWGKRLYLIADRSVGRTGIEKVHGVSDRAARFCSLVNAGYEPRQCADGEFLLRDGDWLVPVTGLPEVPVTWRKMLLMAPIGARVLSSEDGQGRVAIDQGSSDGVREGMFFFPSVTTEVARDLRYVARAVLPKEAVIVRDWARVLWPAFALSKGDSVVSRRHGSPHFVAE